MGRAHTRGAGLRKAAALAVSLVSVARWPGAAGPARMRPGRRQMAGRNPVVQNGRISENLLCCCIHLYYVDGLEELQGVFNQQHNDLIKKI